MKVTVALFLAGSLFARTYSTSFPSAETPISQGGVWINGQATGIDWNNVNTQVGLALGGTGVGGSFADPSAVINGTWGNNQTLQATVHTVNQDSGQFEEVELRMRTNISAHNLTGYEVTYRCTHDGSQYIQIVKWNGAVGDFNYICPGVNCTLDNTAPGLVNGDIVKATIVGSTISAYVNGVLIKQATDSTYASGQPGIGFYGSTSGNAGDYGFTTFSADDGLPSFTGSRIFGSSSLLRSLIK